MGRDDKNHAGIARTFGFICKWAVTHTARHDSGPFEDALDTENIVELGRELINGGG